MSKSNIPPIKDEEAVISWFLKNDDKIETVFFVKEEYFQKAKSEILKNLQEHQSAESLQGFVDKISTIYTEQILPTIANCHKQNQEIPSEILITEFVLSAKMRILGFFLLKKYGIQPK